MQVKSCKTVAKYICRLLQQRDNNLTLQSPRNRTFLLYVDYDIYLYFLGLSTRNVAKALSFLHIIKRSHVAIWKWIQKYIPSRDIYKKKKDLEFIVDETTIKVGMQHIWAMGSHITKKQDISRAKTYPKREKHVCGRKVYRRIDEDS